MNATELQTLKALAEQSRGNADWCHALTMPQVTEPRRTGYIENERWHMNRPPFGTRTSGGIA